MDLPRSSAMRYYHMGKSVAWMRTRGPTTQSPSLRRRSRQARGAYARNGKKFVAWCVKIAQAQTTLLFAQDPSLNLGATNTIDQKKRRKKRGREPRAVVSGHMDPKLLHVIRDGLVAQGKDFSNESSKNEVWLALHQALSRCTMVCTRVPRAGTSHPF